MLSSNYGPFSLHCDIDRVTERFPAVLLYSAQLNIITYFHIYIRRCVCIAIYIYTYNIYIYNIYMYMCVHTHMYIDVQHGYFSHICVQIHVYILYMHVYVYMCVQTCDTKLSTPVMPLCQINYRDYNSLYQKKPTY